MIGFVYIWFDRKRKLFYVGSHMGNPDDGYVGSNVRLMRAYKARPETFRRRILEMYTDIANKELREREGVWLSKIKPEELHGRKYYNEKKVAFGGDIVTTLSEEKRMEHRLATSIASKLFWKNMSDEQLQKYKKNAFGGNTFNRDYLAERNGRLFAKKAQIFHPNGDAELVRNVAEFCRQNNLNYGNMKNALRGLRRSCSGYTGKYIE